MSPAMVPCSALRLGSAATAAVLLAAAPAAAQDGLSGHDNALPIEIVADSLVVEQEKQLATFKGNVDAVQGDVSLRADELRVFYAEDADGAAASAGPAANGPGGAQGIRRIEAEGHVVLASPRETAQGDSGVYDVPAGLVTLDGNVVLTRDENVVRGARLAVDLESGISTVSAAQPAADGGRRDQRVRALFTPERREQP